MAIHLISLLRSLPHFDFNLYFVAALPSAQIEFSHVAGFSVFVLPFLGAEGHSARPLIHEP